MQLLGLEVDDASKLGAVKGCTTNKATINVGHSHQLINGLRGDTSSVKDAHVISSLLVIHISNDRTARGVNTLCGLRGGNLSGSNGPNRLVWFREKLRGKKGSKLVMRWCMRSSLEEDGTGVIFHGQISPRQFILFQYGR